MRIQIGLVGEDSGWKLILGQEGIPFIPLDTPPRDELCSAIVVGGFPESKVFEWLRLYLKEGGCVLCSGEVFAQIAGIPSSRRFVKYIYPEAGSVFAGCGLIDIQSECCIPAAANQMRTDDDRVAVFFGEYGGGLVAALPFDPGMIMRDDRTAAKSFHAPHRRLPHERVSLVTKASIRKLVSRILEHLHHQRMLPYVHAWYYPRDGQNVFSLRIDTDVAAEKDVERVYAVAQKYQIPFSWFVHVKSQESFLQKFLTMKDHEIGIHCYDHIRYRDEDGALRDIHRAMDVVSSVGIQPQGFASPYGMWSPNVGKAIDRFSFEYSSEFSYDYDNLPSFPLLADHASTTLQVPIHPIGIGSLRRQGFTQAQMSEYFLNTIDHKMSVREPLFFYHHPKNGHEQTLEQMIESVRQRNIPVIRMIDYARWWKKRNASSLSVDVQGSTINVRAQQTSEDVWLHVTRRDGTESFVPPRSLIDLQAIEWKKKPESLPLPDDIHRARKFNPWIFINRCEDILSNILISK